MDDLRPNLFLKLSTAELMNVDAADNLPEILLDLPAEMLQDDPVVVRSNILLALCGYLGSVFGLRVPVYPSCKSGRRWQ